VVSFCSKKFGGNIIQSKNFGDFSTSYIHIIFGFILMRIIESKQAFINWKVYTHTCKYTKSKSCFNIFKQELNVYLISPCLLIRKL